MQPQTIRPLSVTIHRAGLVLLAAMLAAGSASGASTDPAPSAANAAAAAAPGSTGAPAAADESASGPALAADAPSSYVVKRGDTLWDIAKLFLRDPWHWPEIWQANPQIHNPHLIYPGDTLRLVYVGGRPQLVLQRGGLPADVERGGVVRLEPRVHSRPLSEAIRTIPYETVQSFMSKPTVLTREQIHGAPYLLAALDGHVAFAQGNTVYARGFKGSAQVGDTFNVIRVGA
ncbi:MAG: LysM peptidoglycan-binding domain-containing protein, partial [Gammaproteobacteria bacterium]|nr:LysM peptidoglycan-binding domain-containing protein [Gammaproteobacteria bacterium]